MLGGAVNGRATLNKTRLISADFRRRYPPHGRFHRRSHVCATCGRADDPDRSAMGSRMKALVGELTKKEGSKAKKALASKQLAKLREAYRQRLLQT